MIVQRDRPAKRRDSWNTRRWLAVSHTGIMNVALMADEFSTELTVAPRSGALTAREKRLARIWQTAPWLALAGVTILPPAALLLAYVLTGFSPLFLVLAITSTPFSLIAAIVVTLVLLLFRRRWARQLRDRLASDGITADEVGFFRSELTTGEKKALRDMEKKQPLGRASCRERVQISVVAVSLKK